MLFDHVKKDMRIYKEEIFGPVLSVLEQKILMKHYN
jgi:malonate-semialdehyde dehydrogenase (acetylating)/methylmalonate-semialdehyde dehydrogenase